MNPALRYIDILTFQFWKSRMSDKGGDMKSMSVIKYSD